MNERRDRVWGSVDRTLNVVIRSHSSADSDGVQEPFLADTDSRRPSTPFQVSTTIFIHYMKCVGLFFIF